MAMAKYIPNEILDQIIQEVLEDYPPTSQYFNEYRSVSDTINNIRATCSPQLICVADRALMKWILARLPILKQGIRELPCDAVNPHDQGMKNYVFVWKEACILVIDAVVDLVNSPDHQDDDPVPGNGRYSSNLHILEETVSVCETSAYTIDYYSNAFGGLSNRNLARSQCIFSTSQKAHQILYDLETNLKLGTRSEFIAIDMDRPGQMHQHVLNPPS